MITTLYQNSYYEVLYNDTPINFSDTDYVDIDKLTNYYIVNKFTKKIEGAAVAASQARKIADLLESLEKGKSIEDIAGGPVFN